jgi:hypothetical protein
MANLKYYNETNSEWETLVIGKQGPSGIANATAPVTYDGGTQTVGLTDSFIGQTVRSYANASARAAAIPSPTEGMVTYLNDVDRLDIHNGTAFVPAISTGAWTAFTPTWTNLTVGNGTYNTSHYTLVGKTATFCIDFVFGSTSAITGAVEVDVPLAISRKNGQFTGPINCFFFDAGTGATMGFSTPTITINNRFRIRSLNTYAGTNPVAVGQGILSSTQPFTWAINDQIHLSGTYEVA